MLFASLAAVVIEISIPVIPVAAGCGAGIVSGIASLIRKRKGGKRIEG